MISPVGAVRRLSTTTSPLRSLVAFLGLVFLVGATGGPLRGLLPVYVESVLQRPPAFSSLLLALLLAGSGVFALLGGALADRLGQKRTLVGGMFWLPLAAALYLLSMPELLIPLALVAGLVEGLQIVGGQAYLVASTPRTSLGIASALFFLGMTFGTSLGSLGAGAVADRWGFGVWGLISVVLAVVLITAAIRFLPEVGTTATPAESAAHAVGRGYLALAGRREFVLIAVLRFLPTYYWGVATLLLPLLLFRLSGSVLAVSIFSAISLGLAAGCQLLTGRISDRLGRGWPVVFLGALVPLVALGTALAAHSFVGLFLVGVLGTMVAWSISVNFPPLVRELTPEGMHGQALGLLHLLWVVAMLLGTLSAGVLVELDPSVPFAIVAALNVPTAFVGIGLWRRLSRAE